MFHSVCKKVCEMHLRKAFHSWSASIRLQENFNGSTVMLYVTKGFFLWGNTKCLIIYVEVIPHTVHNFAPNKISLSLLTVYTLHMHMWILLIQHYWCKKSCIERRLWVLKRLQERSRHPSPRIPVRRGKNTTVTPVKRESLSTHWPALGVQTTNKHVLDGNTVPLDQETDMDGEELSFYKQIS